MSEMSEMSETSGFFRPNPDGSFAFTTPELAILAFDGGAQPNPGNAGCGFLLCQRTRGPRRTPPGGLKRSVRLGHTTSNVAEYMGLINGLREARKQGVTQRLLIGGDSELVIKQMTGEYTTRSPVLQILRHIALGEVARYPSPPEFVAIPREENTEADALATAGSNKALEYKSPDRNVAVYRPNLGCFSYVKIDGVRAVGTNDIRVMNVFHAAMIDAAFLYSLPNGTEYLRNLKPFENISMVTTKGVHLPVLGCVQLAANVEFCASPRQPRRSLEKRVVDRYLVVLDLPVPVHVHHDERRDGFQTSDSDLGGIEKNLDLLPTRYRDHQLYSPELANVVQLGF